MCWRFNKSNIFLFIFAILRVDASVTAKKQKVCVIGAGVAGLVSTKQLADNLKDFDIVVFEKSSEVGGLWNYTDSIDKDEHNLPVHSSMYKNLRTNLPKELMRFPDYRNFSGENRSCVTHETVLEYLKNYTNHFDLRKFIQLNTLVERVKPILGDGDWRSTRWQLKVKNLNTNESFTTVCNAIMVCNGHYFNPRIPNIPGIQTFPGKVTHSHVYRKPDDFKGQTVAILGASSSGISIGIEISNVAKTVYLSHNKNRIKSTLPPNIIQVPGVISANGSTLILKDGSTINNIDRFVYCTGYKYAFPFLGGESRIEVKDNQVVPLYNHLINVEHPSMCFIGIPVNGLYFPLTYLQVHYFISLLQGKVELPNKEAMLNATLIDKSRRCVHSLRDAQWDYYDKLTKAGGLESLPTFYKKGFSIWKPFMLNNLWTYQESNLLIRDNGDIELQHPSI